jgi:RimJ/RimL family protein N-acetyltransferase
MIVIREAAGADAGRLLDLQRRLDQQSSYMLLEPAERPTTPPSLTGGYFFVADAGDSLAGYVNVSIEPYRRARRTGYLVIGVDSAYAGQGLGCRLMQAAIAEGRTRALRRIELTVMTHNLAALRLYLSEGFQVEGLRRACLEVDGAPVDEYYMAVLL